MFSSPFSLFCVSLFSLLVACSSFDFVYNPANGHYYKLILAPSGSISYANASTLAGSLYLNNQQGYLVTITDATEYQALVSIYYTKVGPWTNYTGTGAAPTVYPTFWTGAKNIAPLWYWFALSRQSGYFYDNSARKCANYCNWFTTPATSDTCLRIFLYNTGGPAIGSWISANCSLLIESLLVEFDSSTSCSTGFAYNSTAGWCTDVNECATNNVCGSGYTCANTIGSYTCTDINECLNTTICGSGYSCQNLPGSYSCQDINECVQTPNICGSGYTCNNTIGSYMCNDINECLNSSVCPYANCTNTPGSYYCDVLYYFIYSELSNLTLDINSTNAGSPPVMAYRKTSNLASQLWSFTTDGYIMNCATQFVLDIYGGDLYAGNSVILWYKKPAASAINQMWGYNSTYGYIQSAANANFVIDIYQGNSAPGTPLIIWPPKGFTTDNGDLNQMWSLVLPS